MSDVASHRWLSWSYVDTGTFLIAFHFLGLLYAWGVIQANLNKKGLGGSQLLSLIGGLNAFFTAAFCLPVRGCAFGFSFQSRLTCLRLALALLDLVHTTEIWTTNRRTRRGQLPLALAVSVFVRDGQSRRTDRIARMLCGDRQRSLVHGQSDH
jgi:hypothetical protein